MAEVRVQIFSNTDWYYRYDLPFTEYQLCEILCLLNITFSLILLSFEGWIPTYLQVTYPVLTFLESFRASLQ